MDAAPMSLTTAIRRQGGRVKRRLIRLRSEVAVAAHRSARPVEDITVSIIVPIYNVEAYLDECLDSLRQQRHRNLEILVVDDGSPDGSAAIAMRHAAEDSRIRVIRRDNGGLGAARNTGVREATGDYLCFVDSDDVIPLDAISTMAAVGNKTGSQIVAGAMIRFNSTRRWRPDWVELHAQERLHLRIRDWPSLVRNNYTTGKLYDTTFWRSCNLWFREGVSYEDQPIITQLFIRAKGIDVIPTVTYEWRQRDDLSSISQQMHTLPDLVDRVAAWRESHRLLSVEAPRGVYEAWLTTLYSAHFHWYLRSTSTVDDDYWALLQSSVVEMTAHAPAHLLTSVSPQFRIPVELALRNLRDELHEFIRVGGYGLNNFPAHLEDTGLVMELPTWGDESVGLPNDLYLLRDEDVPFVHRLDRVSWTDDGDLRIAGWAYFRFIDLSKQSTVITLVVRHSSRKEIRVDTHPDPARTLTAPLEDKWADYPSAAFTATIPFADLMAHATFKTGESWAFDVHVRTGRLERSVALTNVHPWGAAPSLAPRRFGDGFVHRTDIGMDRPFMLQYLAQLVAPEELTLDGRTLRGRLRSLRTEHITELSLVNVAGDQVFSFPVSEAGLTPEFSFEVPGEVLATPPPRDMTAAIFSLRAVLASGRTVLVTSIFDDRADSTVIGSRVLSLRSSHRGAVVLEVSAATVEIDAARIDADVLELSGHVPGVMTGNVTLQLTSAKAASHPVTAAIAHGQFAVQLPLRHYEPKFGDAILPTRRFVLTFTVDSSHADNALSFRGEARASSDLTSQLPMPIDGDRVAMTLTRATEGVLVAAIVAPIGAAARGSYNRNRLENEHREGVPARRGEPREGMLIDSYFGEVASCNGVGIQHELRKRGATLPIYWAVKDHSVGVPEGGIPVVRNSLEWYERLRTAKYFVTNMYQPAYHPKPDGQVIIQTFHGYPFKVMGHSHWVNLQNSRKRIESFDQRAAEWDYLISPARYATPLLQREFAYHGRVLEVGYPRNDVLKSAEALQIRPAVREALGIPAGATAVLYAPTFRDYLSVDDHTAPMADILDVDLLMKQLGEEVVLLIRGHAFHARTDERQRSSDRVIDVTDYPEPADLYLASDLAVVDYSSLRFDYGLTGKPMLYLVPDLDLYKETRGWLLDYEPTAPGPLLSTTAEVVTAIQNLDAVVEDFAPAYRKFTDDYLDLDDGHASERVVDAVFVPRGDAPPRTAE